MKVRFKTDADDLDDDLDLGDDLDDAEIEDRATVEIADGADTAVEFPDDEDDPPEQGDDDANEDGDDDDDDDLSAYSKPVRDRIRKERAEAQEARQRAEVAERELTKTRSKAELATIASDLDAAIDEVEEARRDADTRKEVLAQAKVTNLAARKEALERSAESDEPPEGGRKAPNQAVERWVGRNKEWWSDPKYEVQRQAALAIGRKLAANGVKDDSDEFYAELDKELRKSVRLPKDREPPERTTIQRRMSNRTHQNPNSRRVVLTPADQRFMGQLKLDPTNKEHVQAYLKEKRNAR